MLYLSKILTCNLEKHDFKERIHTANKLKVAGQSDKSYCILGSQN